jgi:hypothetical protein
MQGIRRACFEDISMAKGMVRLPSNTLRECDMRAQRLSANSRREQVRQ